MEPPLQDDNLKNEYNSKLKNLEVKYHNLSNYIQEYLYLLMKETKNMDYNKKEFLGISYGLMGTDSNKYGPAYRQFIKYFDIPFTITDNTRYTNTFNFQWIFTENRMDLINSINEYSNFFAYDIIKNPYDGTPEIERMNCESGYNKAGVWIQTNRDRSRGINCDIRKYTNYMDCDDCLLYKNQPKINKQAYFYKNAVTIYNLIRKIVDEFFKIINQDNKFKAFFIYDCFKEDNIDSLFVNFLINKFEAKTNLPEQLLKFKEEFQQFFNSEYRKKMVADLGLDNYSDYTTKFITYLDKVSNELKQKMIGGNKNIKRKSLIKKRKSPTKKRISPVKKNKHKSPANKRK
jgi:hypothetical protein